MSFEKYCKQIYYILNIIIFLILTTLYITFVSIFFNKIGLVSILILTYFYYKICIIIVEGFLILIYKLYVKKKILAWAKENTQAHNFLFEYSKHSIESKKTPEEKFYKYIFNEYFLNLDEYKGLRLLCDKNIKLTHTQISIFLKENKCVTKRIDNRIYLYLDTK